MKPDKKNITFGKAVIIVLLCSVINFLGKYISSLASLPLWLDTVGTFAAAYFTGPVGAVVSGALSNLIFGVAVNISSVLYMVTNAIIGLFYCICTSKGRCEKFTGVMMYSFFAGILSAFFSFDINIFTNGGKCGNFWGDTLFEMLQWNGLPKFVCAFAGEAVIDMLDKPVSMALGFLLVAIFKAVLFSKKNPQKNSTKSGTSAAAALFIASSLILSLAPADVSAEVSSQNYVSTVFDSRNGLISSEANAIAETDDGYIWIGSYAGLSRYDGRRFEFIRTGGITSVKELFVDSNGYLWIGTNDKGVALYRNNEFTFFDTSDGLPSNSIRAFAELPDGSICVATTGNMCRIYPDDTIKSSASNIPYVTSLAVCDGKLFGINNSGLLFLLYPDGTLIEKKADDGYYSCVEANDGIVRAGTSTGTVEIVKEEDGKLVVLTSKSTAPLKHIISIDTDSKGRRWISADNGFGYINSSGELIIKSTNGFDGSVEQVHEDYQGNIWAASSRYGIIKLSENIFSDLFSVDSITGAVCNSVCILDGRIYCATDTGLIMLSETSKKQLTNDLTRLLEGIRIRNITVDGDTLWLSTYSDLGLVRYESDGTITSFNAEEKGTVCNRFRNSYVLSDGTLAAGTVEGINFIRDGMVTGSITMEDGLENSVILCIAEDENNNIYACTDGAGIYVIRDGKIVKNIGTDEGLSSGVVMRLIPYDGGFFAVTTNSLCYMKDDIAVNLENFPYYNNYDVVIKENKACIFSSAGIFVTDAAPLAAGEEISYKLYNINDGLLYGLTANSWSCTDSAGNICFCTNNGILSFDPLSVSNVNTEYIMGISSVRDGDREFKEENSLYIIPADCKRITIEASLRNNSLSNPMVRFFIKEVEDFPQTMLSTELEPIQITNLKYGVYTVCLQVLDDSGKVSSERCYSIVKRPHAWENSWYTLYLFLVTGWSIVLLVWTIIMNIVMSNQKKYIEKLKDQTKNEFLANMSHEIRTPVNTIIGMNEMILREGSDKILDYSAAIRTASDHLISLIDDILDFSYIDSEFFSIEISEYRIDILLKELLKSAKNDAEYKKLTFTSDINRSMPARLLGDEKRIKKIFSSIISNAVKYTSEGGIDIKVDFSLISDDETEIIFTVTDTGIGIKEEDISKLFKDFSRIDYGKNRAIPGSGLGLSITKRLLDMMNGTVKVESTCGKGSVFEVRIPQRAAGRETIEDMQLITMKKAEEFDSNDSENTREYVVLAVDDTPMNLKVIEAMLKDCRVVIETAGSGTECLEKCRSKRYDLILMDHMMPQPDGVETLKMLRDDGNVNSDAPVIVVTANAISGAKEEYIRCGFSDYLPKPITYDKLKTVMSQYIPAELFGIEPGEDTAAEDDDEKLIDIQLGISYCDNSREIYKEMLEIYCEQCLVYRENLHKYKRSEDMPDYGIVVHSLKSASLNIGAKKLSELAKEHETAAKNNDTETVNKKFSSLIRLMDKVTEEAKRILSED